VLHSILIKPNGIKSPNSKRRCKQTQVWIKHGFGTLRIVYDNSNTLQAEQEYKANHAIYFKYPNNHNSDVQLANNKYFSITYCRLISKMHHLQLNMALHLDSSHDHEDKRFDIQFWTIDESNIDDE
jgi:hypothetical protein